MSQQRSLKSWPALFWVANSIELLERAAYYAVASFMVIYFNENLGMSAPVATFLNGSLLWGLIYFMPAISGSLADAFGFRRALLLAFVLLTGGYLLLGQAHFVKRFFAFNDFLFPVVTAIILIGVGGSIVKPCIAGTIQKVGSASATLAFSVFYMIINIGSILGRAISYSVRIRFGLPAIFTYVAALFAFLALLFVFLFYQKDEHDRSQKNYQKIITSLKGVITVLKNVRFTFFLLAIGFYWILYVQIYNLIPLYLRYLSPAAPVELYTLVNPLLIVSLQLLITRLGKKFTAVHSIMLGIIVSACGMLINIVPLIWKAKLEQELNLLGLIMPLGGIFIVISIATMAIGEMLASPRIYEYVGAIAPPKQEGLYLGYVNLPLAFGSIAGAPLGGMLFQKLVKNALAKGQTPDLLLLWLIVAACGLISFSGIYFYNRAFLKSRSPEN